jgi:dephospho-CoA kinase
MFVVGLTGGIGSGKSEAARLFASMGVPVIDTDAIAHQLTAPGEPALEDISAAFGKNAVRSDGALDRELLRRRIFSDPEARKTLERILHPRIREAVIRELNKNTSAPYQIIVVPLLFETTGYTELLARSLIIDCEESLQISRTMSRSSLSESEVRAIMEVQMSRKHRLSLANDVIYNNGTLENLASQVRQMHEKYIKACIVS